MDQIVGGVQRIRVLHLIHTMAYGGIETALLNWVHGFDRQRFEVHVVCFANPGDTEAPFVDAALRLGITVSKIPWNRGKPLLKASRALACLLRERKVDILHTHGWYADFVGALTARLVPVRTITTLYVWFDYDWKRNLIQLIDQWVIRLFDRVTAHCEATRLGTIERGVPAGEVDTLFCGFETHRVEITPEERQSRRAARGVQDGEIVLVNIARFYPEKTHDALLRSFREVLRHHSGVRLWIAGVGPLEDQIRALCHQLGLDEHVDFLGFVTDLPNLLALADIQVHPAAIEGVPLAICEGMAAGLPVVASAVGGLPEVLDHGRSGVLVPAGDEGRFVAEVVRLIENPDEARSMGQRARHFIEHDYSLANAVAKVEHTYQEMMKSCVLASSP